MMLDSRVLEAPLLDHRGLDLDAAGRVTYVLQQSFRYEYDSPVESLRQRLVVVPPARHGSQYRRAHRLDVHGVQARRSVRRDGNGNVVAWLRAERVPEAIEFRLAAVLERVRAGRAGRAARRCPGQPATAEADPADRGRRPAAGARGRPARARRHPARERPAGLRRGARRDQPMSTASPPCGPPPPRRSPSAAASARTPRT